MIWPPKAGPCATLGSPFARSATLMLLKTEKPARSAAGSAAKVFEISRAPRQMTEKTRILFWTGREDIASAVFFSILKEAHLSHSAAVARPPARGRAGPRIGSAHIRLSNERTVHFSRPPQ